MIHRITGPRPPSSEVPIRTRGLWLWYGTQRGRRSSANSVWSRPMPTLRPGCHLVPRWRAMMLPATHVFAAKNLEPQPLTGRIAAVTRGSACFLVSHCWPPNFLDYCLPRIRDKSITAPYHFFLSFCRRLLGFRGRPFRWPLFGLLAPRLATSPGALADSAAPSSASAAAGAGACARCGFGGAVLLAFLAVGQDFGDAQQRELLAVTALAPRVLPAALLEGDDFRPARPARALRPQPWRRRPSGRRASGYRRRRPEPRRTRRFRRARP